MSWPVERVAVRVPATSANLGPGFDALGLALGLYDEVQVEVKRHGLAIDISGEGADTAAAGEGNLVVRAMRAAFAAAGNQPPGLALRCLNRIPHGRGLGSSAAAIVAGVLAARALTGGSPAGPDSESFALATEIEGHPDNVAACLAGGLTIAWREEAGPRLVRLSPLPDVVHADAAANAGRSALLVAALTSDPANLLAATHDLLHQPYRASVMPRTASLLRSLRAAGVPAVVSGAGPSVLVFLTGEPSAGLEVVGSIVTETGNGWLVSPLDVDRQGARVQLGPPDANSGNTPPTAWSGSGYGHGRPGVAAASLPTERSSPSATHGQFSREYRGLSWC